MYSCVPSAFINTLFYLPKKKKASSAQSRYKREHKKSYGYAINIFLINERKYIKGRKATKHTGSIHSSLEIVYTAA